MHRSSPQAVAYRGALGGSERAAPRRLLFIDDDPLYRDAFRRLITPRGFDVDVAASGDEAIGLVRAHQYGVVISDLMLPRIDGLQVIDRVRKVQDGARFVLTTGQDPKDVEASIEGARIDGVLWKPWTPGEAISLVERLTDPGVSALTRVSSLLEIDGTVLLIEDKPVERDLVRAHLEGGLGEAARLVSVESIAAALSLLAKAAPPAVVLLDLALSDGARLDGLKRLLAAGVSAPIVVLSGPDEEWLALEAVELGAQDYLFKDQLHARGLLLTMRHAIDRKRSEERLAQVALYDRLTGAANRALFQSSLESAIERAAATGKKLALLFLDLDNFKEVNDRFGHQVGDALLSAFAMRLMDCLAESHLLCRLGGDEFVVLASDIEGSEGANQLAAKLLSATVEPVELTDQAHRLSASIGIALYPEHGHDEAQLLRHADLDMYRAKGRRRRRSSRPAPDVQYEQDEAALRPALERGEFVPHYQAVVDLPSQQVSEIELLLRWHRESDGVLDPDAFLPLLKETGMIIPVARSSLREAFRQLHRFQFSIRRPCRLSFNVSTEELAEHTFSHDLRHWLTVYDITTSDLQLEVSEETLASDSQAVHATLAALRVQGVELCLDAFGADTASLHRLTGLGLGSVKIDRSVIAQLGETVESEAFVAATIASARAIGLRVVAVGVEREVQHRALERLGCGQAQGSYYAVPMSAHALGTWLSRRAR